MYRFVMFLDGYKGPDTSPERRMNLAIDETPEEALDVITTAGQTNQIDIVVTPSADPTVRDGYVAVDGTTETSRSPGSIRTPQDNQRRFVRRRSRGDSRTEPARRPESSSVLTE